MKKGFTLVELLAAIVLIALIIGVSIPAYNKYVTKSRKDSFKESLVGLSRAIELHVASDTNSNYAEPVNILTIGLEAENISNIQAGSFYVKNGKVILVDVTNGYYCGNGYKKELVIKDGNC